MKRLCLGTLLNILYQARNNSKVTNDVLCSSIFKAFGADFEHCGSTSGHLKSGHDNVPGPLKDAAGKLDFEAADIGFQNEVVKHIKNVKKESVIRAIKSVLDEDETIKDYTVVGYIHGYEKRNLIEMPKVSFSAVLASVFFFAITEVKDDCFEAIKEIDKDFVESFDDSDVPVYFESSDAEQILPLNRSLKDPVFNRTFEKVSELDVVGVANHSTVQIYTVDMMNSKLRFKNAKEFLVSNISNYVMSREKAARMDKVGKSAAMGTEALLRYIKAFDASAESILGETLLYVFLEQELDAPKILTKIEIDDVGGLMKSKSDGVHLLVSDDRGIPFHQLVFGASNIVGDLHSAVDNAFQKIIAIENNYEDELQLVDNTRTQSVFRPEVNNYIKSILIPEKNKGTERDMAFGCFLGYTLTLPHPESNNDRFRAAARDKMAADIADIEKYIEQKVVAAHLEGYSFYFYVLPFNDAPAEKVGLVEEMIGRA
ncbi:MAG: DUF1837 domain-containing protein [Lachnospiraceae bacterium]|nr:DUF1837 domain-containing protein [Lachnospiraceae bacterium]